MSEDGRELRRWEPGTPMSKRKGRPPTALNSDKREWLLSRVREGFSLGTAARLCGFSLRVIQRRAEREPGFARELDQALASRVALLEKRLLDLAAQTKQPAVSLQAITYALTRTGGPQWSDSPKERQKECEPVRSDSFLSAECKLRILRRDRFTCKYCGVTGADAELQIDHIIPVSQGGSNMDANLTTACRSCNQSKSDGPPKAEET